MPEIKLVRQNWRRFQNKKCYKCHRGFRMGQVIISRPRHGKRLNRCFHKHCWQSLFFDSKIRVSEKDAVELLTQRSEVK